MSDAISLGDEARRLEPRLLKKPRVDPSFSECIVLEDIDLGRNWSKSRTDVLLAKRDGGFRVFIDGDLDCLGNPQERPPLSIESAKGWREVILSKKVSELEEAVVAIEQILRVSLLRTDGPETNPAARPAMRTLNIRACQEEIVIEY
jgi:hypothetical protein